MAPTLLNTSSPVLEKALAIAPALRAMLADDDGIMGTNFFRETDKIEQSELVIHAEYIEDIYNELLIKIESFRSNEGRIPKTIGIKNVGIFKVSSPANRNKRLQGRITIVTGSAQGFGKGIADLMAKEGARVIYADLNQTGAEKASAETNACLGEDASMAIAVNVGNEEEIKAMLDQVVLHYGGLDVLVNNAGIVRAGSLDEMTKETFEFSTKINYTAYFLGVKYAQKIMRIQTDLTKKLILILFKSTLNRG